MNEPYPPALLKNDVLVAALGTVTENDDVKRVLNSESETHIPTPDSSGSEGRVKSEREKWRSDFGL